MIDKEIERRAKQIVVDLDAANNDGGLNAGDFIDANKKINSLVYEAVRYENKEFLEIDWPKSNDTINIETDAILNKDITPTFELKVKSSDFRMLMTKLQLELKAVKIVHAVDAEKKTFPGSARRKLVRLIVELAEKYALLERHAQNAPYGLKKELKEPTEYE